MEDVDFSDEFCRFVQVHVPSVDHAEQLLAEYRAPDSTRGPEWARSQQAFRGAGLTEDEVERHLATLAQAYEERPVTLVRLIYALRDRSIQSFADAFRLRRK